MLETPAGYDRFLIDGIDRDEGALMIRYGGRAFAGAMVERFGVPGLADAIAPGAEIIVRYHTAETGAVGQVAHMLVRHPFEDAWAEIYIDA